MSFSYNAIVTRKLCFYYSLGLLQTLVVTVIVGVVTNNKVFEKGCAGYWYHYFGIESDGI